MNLLTQVLGFLGLAFVVWLLAFLTIIGLACAWNGAWRLWSRAARRWRRFRHSARLAYVAHCQSVVDGEYVEENIGWLAQVGMWELEASAEDRRLPKERRK